ncbi:MAG: hypothetical protein IJU76_14195 [Desulfovibrionaceae bacterium]|nr:hypothetical protein [Desulfovibrionaceae bacterium]
MYQIVSNGEVVALCDKPRYVRVKPQSGAYIETDAEHAEALAVNGVLYSLPDKTPIGDAPVAFVSSVDGGNFVFDNYVPASKYAASIAALEDAMCEIDTVEGV